MIIGSPVGDVDASIKEFAEFNNANDEVVKKFFGITHDINPYGYTSALHRESLTPEEIISICEEILKKRNEK